MPLESVGPYRILKKLGAGGLGEVFLAEDTRLKRRVALKSLVGSRQNEPPSAPEARRRLLHEARAAAALNHPNIAAVYDVVENESGAWIVMEYVPGRNLAEVVNDGAMPSPAVAWIGGQLCTALVEAHAHGIIHRDVKPANLVLTPDGRLKVLDFGVAKALALDSSAPPTGALDLSQGGRLLVGTPAYIPPEKYLGQSGDERGDIYSAGVSLYELATGRRPFHGGTATALAEAILHDTPPRPSSVKADIDPGLEAVVLRAMSRQPGDRYPTAAAMRDDIARIRGSWSSWPTLSQSALLRSTRALPSWSRLGRGTRAALLALAVALAGVGLLVGKDSFGRPTSGARIPVVVVLPLDDLSGDPGNVHLGVGIADVLIASLARLPGVNVVSRNVADSYAEPKRNARRIARDLGADYVVGGTVQRSADQLRVTLSLVQATTSLVSWSEAHDGTLAGVFALEQRAAEALAGALRLKLVPVGPEKPPPVSAEAFSDYAEGRALLERSDVPANLDRAIALFERVIAAAPRFALAHAGLGQAYWSKYTETRDAAWTVKARAATEEALRLDPGQAPVRVALAQIDEGTGRRDAAVEELTKAVGLQPNSDDAHRELGRLLARTGRFEAGLAHLATAVSLRPNYWRNHVALGRAYFNRGDFAEASRSFQRVTELRPESASGFQMLGTAQHAAGDKAGALRSYLRAVEVQPNAESYSNLGTVYYEQGRLAEAAAAYEKAIGLKPGDPEYRRNLGDVYRRLGLRDKARTAYEDAVARAEALLKVNPADAMAWGRLGVYRAKLGDRANAARAAEKARTLAPSSGDVFYFSAVVHALHGQAEESLADVRRAVANGYSREFLRADEDLAVLWTQADYRQLMNAKP